MHSVQFRGINSEASIQHSAEIEHSAVSIERFKVTMAKGRVLAQFWQFLLQEKKYWLMPIVIVFVLFGLLIVFSQSTAVAPFIYTLF